MPRNECKTFRSFFRRIVSKVGTQYFDHVLIFYIYTYLYCIYTRTCIVYLHVYLYCISTRTCIVYLHVLVFYIYTYLYMGALVATKCQATEVPISHMLLTFRVDIRFGLAKGSGSLGGDPVRSDERWRLSQ